MSASLSADPDKIPDGGTTEICIAGAAANSDITITCKDAGGEKKTFTIESDANGNGCHSFTAPTGWTDFTVEGGGASGIAVIVGA